MRLVSRRPTEISNGRPIDLTGDKSTELLRRAEADLYLCVLERKQSKGNFKGPELLIFGLSP